MESDVLLMLEAVRLQLKAVAASFHDPCIYESEKKSDEIARKVLSGKGLSARKLARE